MNSRGTNNWWQKKRNWFFIALVFFFLLFIWSLPSELPGNIAQIGKAYSDPEICENALQIAKDNHRVQEVLGKLDPMGAMALIEGSVKYTKGGDSVPITINVKGDKSKKRMGSKMDIRAYNENDNWKYQKIQIQMFQLRFPNCFF